MRIATTIAHWLLRLTGLTQLVLGGLFWSGNLLTLVPVHMLVGLVLVLALWGLAALAARAGAPPGLVALAAVWGLVVPALGLLQGGLLVGPAHWVIQVVHLLVGLGAIGQGEALAARIKARLAASADTRRPVLAEGG